MRKIFLHIGYPKTATTFLQSQIFPEIENIRYLGRYDGLENNLNHLNILVELLGHISDHSFEARLPEIGYNLKNEEVSKYGNVDDQIPLLISEEVILFRTIQPMHLPWLDKMLTVSPETVFKRLKIWAERENIDLHIILTIRNQADLIHSLYAEKYYYYNQFEHLNSFDKYLNVGLSKKHYGDYGLINLEFDRVLKFFSNFFDKSKLILLKYDQLKDEPELFFSTLQKQSQFDINITVALKKVNQKVNQRMKIGGVKRANVKINIINNPSIKVLSTIKRMFFKSNKSIDIFNRVKKLNRLNKGVDILLSKKNTDIINKRYKESNERLASDDNRLKAVGRLT